MAVLGAVLLHDKSLDDAAELVFPQDFYRVAHALIFKHMQLLAAKSEPIDFTTLRESLTRARELDAVGGMVYVNSLISGLPHATNITHYAQIVREKSRLREVIDAANQALAAAYRAESDAAQIVDVTQQALFEIATHHTARGLVAAPDLASELMQAMDALTKNKGAITGVPSGLVDLDYLTAGFQKGDLILLAARPSMGKTALALGAAYHAATTAKKHVAVFSLEMNRASLGLRLIGGNAQIDSHRLRTGQIWDAEYPRIANAINDFGESWLHIDDASILTMHQVRARARKLKMTVGLDFVVIDYLQLLDGMKSENRNLEVAGISRGLKSLARDLDVPVLALSQLSRASENRAIENRCPQLSDLRDSGALEQDSDVVIFLYREEVYRPSPDLTGVAELVIAKQRNGPTGTAKVFFQAHTTTFHNLSYRHERSA